MEWGKILGNASHGTEQNYNTIIQSVASFTNSPKNCWDYQVFLFNSWYFNIIVQLKNFNDLSTFIAVAETLCQVEVADAILCLCSPFQPPFSDTLWYLHLYTLTTMNTFIGLFKQMKQIGRNITKQIFRLQTDPSVYLTKLEKM